MSIIIQVQLTSGIVLEDACLRIEHIVGNKTNLTAIGRIYLDKDSVGKTMYLEERIFNFEPSVEDDSVRWDKQTYEYIKTLPEYENAIDC